MTVTATNIDTLIDQYIAIWNETDPATRRALIDRTWATDATYSDPALEGAGRDGIDAMTAGFQAAYPDHRFERIEPTQDANGEQRFGWKLLTPTGEVFITGEDDFRLQADGLFASIVGRFNQ